MVIIRLLDKIKKRQIDILLYEMYCGIIIIIGRLGNADFSAKGVKSGRSCSLLH